MKIGRCPKCDASRLSADTDVFPRSGPFTGNALRISLTALVPLDNAVPIEWGRVEGDNRTAVDPDSIQRQWWSPSGAAAKTMSTVDDGVVATEGILS